MKEDRFIGRFVRVWEHLEEDTDILEIGERIQLVTQIHTEFIPMCCCAHSEPSMANYVCVLFIVVNCMNYFRFLSLCTLYLGSIFIPNSQKTMILHLYTNLPSHWRCLVLDWDPMQILSLFLTLRLWHILK